MQTINIHTDRSHSKFLDLGFLPDRHTMHTASQVEKYSKLEILWLEKEQLVTSGVMWAQCMQLQVRLYLPCLIPAKLLSNP